MPWWKIGESYKRSRLEQMYPDLGPRGAVAQARGTGGARDARGEVAVVILREGGAPRYLNCFEDRKLHMEIQAKARDNNALLKNPQLHKVLFWQERDDYLCLGPIEFVEEKDPGGRPIYTFAVTDAAAPVPSTRPCS
jgi:hypothetical protein